MNRIFFPLFFIALPLAEIATFVLVGRQIGALATVGLVVASMVAGVMLLRYQASRAAQRLRGGGAQGNVAAADIAGGALVVLAGILLLIPGFLTDIVGLLLLLPPVRALARRRFGDRVTIVTSGFSRAGFGQRGTGGGRTIDLDEDDYRRTRPDGDSPWKRIDDDRQP